MTRILSRTAATAIALALAACATGASGPADPIAQAAMNQPAPSAADYLRMAAASDQYEIQSSRLVLASTLQRLPVGRRVQLAEALVSRAEDAADHNIPLIGGDGWVSEELKNAGDALDGCFFSDHYSQQDPRPERRARLL